MKIARIARIARISSTNRGNRGSNQQPAKVQAGRQIVKEFLDDDILRPITSEWGAPALIVPKPKSGWRLVVDLRELNKHPTRYVRTSFVRFVLGVASGQTLPDHSRHVLGIPSGFAV